MQIYPLSFAKELFRPESILGFKIASQVSKHNNIALPQNKINLDSSKFDIDN